METPLVLAGHWASGAGGFHPAILGLMLLPYAAGGLIALMWYRARCRTKRGG